MKYKPEDYVNSGYWEGDEDVTNLKNKVVCCRKPHVCVSCQTEIPKGDYMLNERAFLYGEPISSYTCLPCIDKWLDEILCYENEVER